MDTFEMYYEKFMKMRKADIIREGQTWEIWANCQSTANSLMKWKKPVLARVLVGRLDRLEKRGY